MPGQAFADAEATLLQDKDVDLFDLCMLLGWKVVIWLIQLLILFKMVVDVEVRVGILLRYLSMQAFFINGVLGCLGGALFQGLVLKGVSIDFIKLYQFLIV